MITNVFKEHNGWYAKVDSISMPISLGPESHLGELKGTGTDFAVFQKDNIIYSVHPNNGHSKENHFYSNAKPSQFPEGLVKVGGNNIFIIYLELDSYNWDYFDEYLKNKHRGERVITVGELNSLESQKRRDKIDQEYQEQANNRNQKYQKFEGNNNKAQQLYNNMKPISKIFLVIAIIATVIAIGKLSNNGTIGILAIVLITLYTIIASIKDHNIISKLIYKANHGISCLIISEMLPSSMDNEEILHPGNLILTIIVIVGISYLFRLLGNFCRRKMEQLY
jgi:hypothetical protein